MILSTDAARSDFILAAALLVIAPFALSLVVAPIETLVGEPILSNTWITLALILLVTVAFPRWLASQRGDNTEAFALSDSASHVGPGVVLAVPIVLAYVATQWTPLGPIDALMGRLSTSLAGTPTVQPEIVVSLGDRLLQAATIVVLFLGSAAIWSFLVGRARRAFDSPDRTVTQALRTYGMGAAAATLVIGGLWSLVNDFGRPVVVLANVAALVAVILLADRMIGLAPTTTRATFIGPMIVLVYLQLQGGADLGFNAYAAALSAGYLVVFAALIESRKTTWAVLPLVLASAWFPGCSGLLYWANDLGNPGC